ncbi:MAG: hypothetical protein LBJ12_08850 [Oscillospiraceae bacterium]|nr:hypothetical protein [Oscillospiraceae bacterium]
MILHGVTTDERLLEVTLPQEEAIVFIKMLNRKLTSKNISACGFNVDTSVQTNDKYYCIALDRCELFYLNRSERCLKVTNEDRPQAEEIFHKYGAIVSV